MVGMDFLFVDEEWLHPILSSAAFLKWNFSEIFWVKGRIHLHFIIFFIITLLFISNVGSVFVNVPYYF